MTVEEGIELLETLGTVEVQLDGNISIPALYVPKPRKEIEQLLTLANIPIPEILPAKIKSKPNTKTKLKNVANKSKTKIDVNTKVSMTYSGNSCLIEKELPI
jgi:hypothetical protein